jgi:beta-mannosidase
MKNGRAVFRSDVFAWGVCIDLDGEKSLPDNFFDLYPGIPYSIPWKSKEAPRIVKVGNLV